MLITIMENAPAEEGPRKLVQSSIDAILAEILGGSAALHELMGPAENLAGALNNLVALFLQHREDIRKLGDAVNG